MLQEVEDISQTEHDDIVLSFNLMHELEYLRNLLIKLRQMGYPQEEEQKLVGKYKEILAEIEQSTKELRDIQTWLTKHT